MLSLNWLADLAHSERFTVHLRALDSSVSGLRALRSSVAETTGNSSTKAQPRKLKERMRANESRTGTEGFRQIQKAGSANDNQNKFRINSIAKTVSLLGPSYGSTSAENQLDPYVFRVFHLA